MTVAPTRKYWEWGEDGSEGLISAIGDIIDRHVGLALQDWIANRQSGWMAQRDVEFIDSDVDLVMSVRLSELVKRSVECFSGPGSDDSTVAWLRESREELLLCVNLIDAALAANDGNA